jgi:hypothetical protein
VQLEVLVEVVDALREKGDLDLGRAGVTIVETVFGDDLGLLAIDDLGHAGVVSSLGFGPSS